MKQLANLEFKRILNDVNMGNFIRSQEENHKTVQAIPWFNQNRIFWSLLVWKRNGLATTFITMWRDQTFRY